MGATPVVQVSLVYPGDVTHMLGEVKGPSHLRELFTAVEAVYDADSDTTDVGFVYGTRCSVCWGILQPDALAERVTIEGQPVHDRFNLVVRHPEGTCPS